MKKENVTEQSYLIEEEMEILVRKFESCELPLADFSHREHLTVALWYLSKLKEREAIDRMREGLLRFINHYGETGYHETITLFWLKVVRGFLEQAGEGRPLAQLASELIETRGNSRLISDYFSKELISSAKAKEGWVEPDLKPLG
jgi:hypothetical protein